MNAEERKKCRNYFCLFLVNLKQEQEQKEQGKEEHEGTQVHLGWKQI